MKNSFLSIVCIILCWSFCNAQQTNGGIANNWYCGEYIALNFNGLTPNFMSNSSSYSWGGSMTMSDKNGDLLFYGHTGVIYDSTHQIMQNGLLSQTGTSNYGTNEVMLGYSHCTYVVPRPCHPNQYFFIYPRLDSLPFITGSTYVPVQLSYSLIDMTLNNGLGGVVMGQKNVIIDSNYTSRNLSITKHANNIDYWALTVRHGTNQYRAYQITSTGISNVPVVSNMNIFYEDSTNGFVTGQLKFSNSGNKLAVANHKSPSSNFGVWPVPNPPAFELMDFNRSTGQLSNYLALDFDSTFYNWFFFPPNTYQNAGAMLMSVEFSPNDQLLYCVTTTALIQYDLSSNNNAIIPSAWHLISNITGIHGNSNYTMQTGPDGRIYFPSVGYVPSTNSNLNSISTINNPNIVGSGCSVQFFTYPMSDTNLFSFPSILSEALLDRSIKVTDTCHLEATHFTLADTFFIDSTQWVFGDSSALLTSDSLPVSHTYLQPGSYPVTVYLYSGCTIDTLQDSILIRQSPIADLGPDTILCEGDSLEFIYPDSGASYLWSTGDTLPNLQILQSDTYWLAVNTLYCGADTDTVVIDSLIPALVHLPTDTLLCEGDTAFLDARVEQGTYIWNTGSTDSVLAVTTAGVYTVTSSNFCGTDQDTSIVDFISPPNLSLGNDTVLCQNDTLFLDASDTLSTYLWYDGDTTALDTITTTGVYWVTDSNMCGVSSDTIEAWFVQPPTANLGADTVICIGDTIQLSDTTLFGSYQWSTNQTTDTIAVYQSGIYSLTVTNVCGSIADTLVVETEIVPTINLGNDTLICQGDSVILDATFSRSTYQWSTGATDSIIVVYQEGIYTVTTTNMCGLMIDSLYLDVDSNLIPNLGPDTILCSGDVYTLNPQTPADSYLWSTGSTADSITIQTEDNYTVSVSNVCGTFTDEVNVYYDNSPVTNLGPDSTYCLTDLVELDAYWSRATYLWNTGQTDSAIIANNSGQYWVEVTNLCGYDDDTVRISYIVPISFDLGSDTTLCVGEILQLGAPAHEATYQWNTGETDSTITVNQPDYYTVSVSNLCGTFSDGIRVYYDSLPQAKLPNDTILCEDERITVTVDPQNATQMEWSMGGSQREVTFTEAGSYVLTLSNHCGETRDTLNIAYQPNPGVNLGSDTIICLGEEIELKNKVQYSVAYAYEWSDGSESETLTINQSGEYSLTVTDSIGCEGTDVIWVEDCGITIYIPNAFTPNGDGMNDIFKVEGDGFEEFDFSVFNRWGEKLFQTQNPEQGWDGTYRNEPVEIGVYSYRIWVEAEGYASKTFIGKITLVK